MVSEKLYWNDGVIVVELEVGVDEGESGRLAGKGLASWLEYLSSLEKEYGAVSRTDWRTTFCSSGAPNDRLGKDISDAVKDGDSR